MAADKIYSLLRPTSLDTRTLKWTYTIVSAHADFASAMRAGRALHRKESMGRNNVSLPTLHSEFVVRNESTGSETIVGL